MEEKKSYACELKRMRTRLGISQAEFAGIIKCPLKTYQRWEQEGFKPYIFTLLSMAYFDICEIANDTDDTSLRYVPQSERDPEQVEIENFDDHHEELDYPWDTDHWCLRD